MTRCLNNFSNETWLNLGWPCDRCQLVVLSRSTLKRSTSGRGYSRKIWQPWQQKRSRYRRTFWSKLISCSAWCCSNKIILHLLVDWLIAFCWLCSRRFWRQNDHFRSTQRKLCWQIAADRYTEGIDTWRDDTWERRSTLNCLQHKGVTLASQ
jgi:hypothetical protein